MFNGETYFGTIDKNASGQRLFGVNHAYWFVAFLKASCFVAIERPKPSGSLRRKQINEDEAKIVYTYGFDSMTSDIAKNEWYYPYSLD